MTGRALPIERAQIVKLARLLERQLAKRRALLKHVDKVEDSIFTTRRALADMVKDSEDRP